jgi:hypothetical protein
MAENRDQPTKDDDEPEHHFDVSTGLKRVLGRELITNDDVAIFEMVKNSFDARASAVHIYFGEDSVVIADNGFGMSYEDLKQKWLFVAYSAKREQNLEKDFRDVVAERGHYAGSKGIGRFSSDRLGDILILQSRPKAKKSGLVHKLEINWNDFEKDDKRRFETIPVEYSEESKFKLPYALGKFASNITHGTVIEIKTLRQKWDREALLSLKSSLAKLINPFGSGVDSFNIFITAPVLASLDMTAKRGGTASLDRGHHAQLAMAHMPGIGRTPSIAMAAEDVRHLQLRHGRMAMAKLSARSSGCRADSRSAG